NLLAQLEIAVHKELQLRHIQQPLMIGIHTGGVWIAQQLHRRLQLNESLGMMDISFYRDDFSQIGMHPQIKPSSLPLSIEGRDVILVDDVFHTGRTARAALNEIFDFGRPNQVLLAVLIERNGRQIPLRPDCVGCYLELSEHTRIKLTGAEPLALHVFES
ncbi:MAG: bifunctional pyr operon transcriptional regulator/uracil phosphoribosyltransferase PyrR, partial [Pseudomonadota bacterium]